MAKNIKPVLSIALLLMIALFSFWFFYLRNAKENELFKQGNETVQKIEKFKKKNGRLPNSLSEIGIAEKDETDPPLYYDRRDSVNYTVSFSTSMDDSKFYYSDSKKWEDAYRPMK